MQLYNTLTRQIEEFKPLNRQVRMYSCGPTVYDRVHIGNLSSFTYSDILRRAITASGHQIRHVMNYTDVDDKTIIRSRDAYPSLSPEAALSELSRKYIDAFQKDMMLIGNAVYGDIEFVSATESIEGMRELIRELHNDGFAYLADDGVYFSIDKYVSSGRQYGQLSTVTTASTATERIQNDEYDKDSAHDFALWKKQKPGEPAWSFELEGKDISGRPGWHIECSVMSVARLGQPFDIHTGGIDLIFPHHENEIAQSTAANGERYANLFFHNEHLLVDGKKMSKSLNNFYTLEDIVQKGFDPQAFRLFILQSHYRKQAHFTWDNLSAAQNRLRGYERMADLKWQAIDIPTIKDALTNWSQNLIAPLYDDLNTPETLRVLSDFQDEIETKLLSKHDIQPFQGLLNTIRDTLGLDIADRPDITQEQKSLIKQRQAARDEYDWDKSDKLRDELKKQGIHIRDTVHGQIWSRL